MPKQRPFSLGMLAGAPGWDPSHNIPDNIQQSLDEAKRSLEIANSPFFAFCDVATNLLKPYSSSGLKALLNG